MTRSKFRAPLAAASAILVPLLSGCDDAVMNPAGEVARQQRDIIFVSVGLMLLIIVPVMILTMVFAWHYRASNREANYDPEFDHSTTLELVIWTAPLLIIIALGALTWSSTHVLDPFRRIDPRAMSLAGGSHALSTEPLLHVQVVGLDWKWLFIYPELGIATVNELALPVNREVRFDLTSTNMMPTFYAPTLAGMIYAMPGMQSTLHAVLNRPVESYGMAANYTGAGFADMRFKLHGLPPAEFDRWVAGVRASGATLGTPAYLQLVRPSSKVPAMHFAGVQPDLFQRILERCVEPGKPCMSQVMRRDRAVGGTHPHDPGTGSGMPQRGESAPLHGDKPEGALFKQPDERTGPGRGTPARPQQAPGVTDPGNPKNRDISLNFPLAGPRAARASLG